jgi:hypothetical protein
VAAPALWPGLPVGGQRVEMRDLTRRSIGQCWIHHTNDDGKSYGTKTREWQLDTVVAMRRVETDDDIAFTLDFTKARERAPHNRADFAPLTIVLRDDEWQVIEIGRGASGRMPSPLGQKFYAALRRGASAGLGEQ